MCFSQNAGAKQAQAVQDQEAAAEARHQQAVTHVNALYGIGDATNAQALNGLYDKVSTDTQAPLLSDAGLQLRDANRNLRFNMARAGQAGGSLAVDQQRNVDDAYQRGLIQIALRGESARNAAVASDASNRIDIINRINAGMNEGDAIQASNTEMQASLETAKQQALINGLGSLFNSLASAQQHGGVPGVGTVLPTGANGGAPVNTLNGKTNSGQITN